MEVIGAIKDTSYWAAFVVMPNASDRIAQALQGGSEAESYEPSSALTYIKNE
ncbi:hypothetical protein LTR95_014633, partial [Oleoguttula sp. CCFEE 5521]